VTGEVVFQQVWYRAPDRGFRPSQAAWDDVGLLRIQNGGARYAGRQNTVTMDRILAVRLDWVRGDRVGRWIIVTYDRDGEERLASFHDGRALGWRGKFGGNKRIIEALEKAVRGDAGGR
jgi:hypothetical protein